MAEMVSKRSKQSKELVKSYKQWKELAKCYR